MTAAEHASGLRQLADWIEQNEKTLKPDDLRGAALLICRIDKDEFLEAVEALGVEGAEITSDSYLNVSRWFGPIKVQVYIDTSKVGESTTRLRKTSEWELHEDVRAVLHPGEPRGHSMRVAGAQS